MTDKRRTYGFLLIGIFVISFGFRSLHFLEHHSQENHFGHKCKSHNHSHDSDDNQDCSLCDFTFSSSIETDFFDFKCFVLSVLNTKVNVIYLGCFSCQKYTFSSLRAPPV